MKDQNLRAGFAKLPINPPFDCEMAGFVARKERCRGMHDHLWVRALVLDDGQGKLAFAVADLIGLAQVTVRKIRKEVAALTDIPAERVMICAIHTHAGPATIEQGYLGQPDSRYIQFLVQNVAGAIYAANQQLEPVNAFLGTGECALVGKNRRHPGGPTDPNVSVLRLDQNGHCKVLLVNYACHPVVLGPDNLLLSADYPYYLIQTLEKLYPGAEIIFTNGATGDINVGHNAADSIRGSANSKRTFREAERLGRILAGEVLEAAENAQSLTESNIRFASHPVELVLEKPLDCEGYQAQAALFEAEFQKLQKQNASYGEIQQAKVWTSWAQKMQSLAATGNLDSKLVTEVAAFKIGNAVFVTFPGEFFHEFGMQVRNCEPGMTVFVMGYANDIIGYVGTSKAYDEGGYEVEDSYRYFGLPSKLTRGSGERVVEEAKNLLQMI